MALGDTVNWKLSGGEGINVSSVVFSDHPHEFKDSEKGYGIALASVVLKHSVDSQGPQCRLLVSLGDFKPGRSEM